MTCISTLIGSPISCDALYGIGMTRITTLIVAPISCDALAFTARCVASGQGARC